MGLRRYRKPDARCRQASTFGKDVSEKTLLHPRICGIVCDMNTQFLTDVAGTRVAVVLPVDEVDDLMEDVSDLAAIAERRDEERSSLAEVKQRLISDGLLQG